MPNNILASVGVPTKNGEAVKESVRTQTLKRYNLALPEELFEEIQELADRKHTTVLEIIRRFIKLGLLAAKVEESSNAELIIREGDKERQIVFL